MKRVFGLMLMMAIFFCFGNVAFAQSNGSTQSFSTQTLNGQGYVDSNIKYSTERGFMTDEEARAVSSAGLPSVKAEQVSNWAERKGFDIVGILQTVVQPLAIIAFIFCAFMALFGVFGNGKMTTQGLVGMMVSCIVYAVVLYAPEILNFVMEWVRE